MNAPNILHPLSFIGHSFPGNGTVLCVVNWLPVSNRYLVLSPRGSRYAMSAAPVQLGVLQAVVDAAALEQAGFSARTVGRLDSICRRITAFATFTCLVNARGGYRPSIYAPAHCRWSFRAKYWTLAAAYDAFQAARGDSRRAYTGGDVPPLAL